MAACNAAQDVLALLNDYQITDVDIDIDFRESFYVCEVGPRLLNHVHIPELDPLPNITSPLTPALGLPISTKANPNTQGTMALYLAEGGDSDRPLGLSCRHAANVDYVHRHNRPPRMSSCSARLLSPTSSIRSNSGSDTACRFSA